TSPSTTHRQGSASFSGSTSSGKYRFIGRSSRLWSRISSPSRKTSVRKPSHLGSNCQPSPAGSASAALESMGASGEAKGSGTAESILLRTAPLAAAGLLLRVRDLHHLHLLAV